jgi:hypothetical protein
MHLPFESNRQFHNISVHSRYSTFHIHLKHSYRHVHTLDLFLIILLKLSLAVVYDEDFSFSPASFINVYDNELMNINEMKLTEK